MDEQSLHTDTVHDWITGYLTNSLTPEEMQSFQECLGRKQKIFLRYTGGMDSRLE